MFNLIDNLGYNVYSANKIKKYALRIKIINLENVVHLNFIKANDELCMGGMKFDSKTSNMHDASIYEC
jgi:hypothetical protein